MIVTSSFGTNVRILRAVPKFMGSPVASITTRSPLSGFT